MPLVDVKVPDIGDFSDVPVIDVLVKAGDVVKREDPLVTVESEKATMDIPSPAEGVVKTITVKIGDKVSEGSALLTLESGVPAQGAAPSKPVSATPVSPTPSPAVATCRFSWRTERRIR
jgi:pyruvate/2-oxoglutarate dehydrogenase complex dihydrolipoamide acyltransferase (E2) component